MLSYAVPICLLITGLTSILFTICVSGAACISELLSAIIYMDAYSKRSKKLLYKKRLILRQHQNRAIRKNCSLGWIESDHRGGNTIMRSCGTLRKCELENCGNSFARNHIPDLNASFARFIKGDGEDENRPQDLSLAGSFASDTMYADKKMATIE